MFWKKKTPPAPIPESPPVPPAPDPLFAKGQGREGLAPDIAAILDMPPETAERRVRSGFVHKLLRFAARLPFADDLAAAWYCAMDDRTPVKVRAVLFGALAYFVIPADALPDVIVGLGFTDDATVLAAALGIVGSHIRPQHRRAARRLLDLPEPPAASTP